MLKHLYFQILLEKQLVKRELVFGIENSAIVCPVQAFFDTQDLVTPQHLSSHPSKGVFKPNNCCSTVVPSSTAFLQA